MADGYTGDGLLTKTAENFMRWFDNGEFTPHGNVFDIGISTSKAVKNLKKDMRPTESGCGGVNENGNGSLMRIAPLVFHVADKPKEKRFEIVRQVSLEPYRPDGQTDGESGRNDGETGCFTP
jgi:ADP-ribosylglycohydrolase